MLATLSTIHGSYTRIALNLGSFKSLSLCYWVYTLYFNGKFSLGTGECFALSQILQHCFTFCAFISVIEQGVCFANCQTVYLRC